MDDQPREEFSPRQRHTLKEFAVSSLSPVVSTMLNLSVGNRNARNGIVER